MRIYTRPTREPLDAPIQVVPNMDLELGDSKPIVNSAMLLLAHMLDTGRFIRLTVTGDGESVEWRHDDGWWLDENNQRFDRTEAISIMAVLKGFAGITPSGPAADSLRKWPAGHFVINYRGNKHYAMVNVQGIVIGEEIVVLYDDGLALAYMRENETERERMIEDSDTGIPLRRMLACGPRFVKPYGILFPTIRSALDGARRGTRIIIAEGTYEEQLSISTPVQLLGEGADKVKVVSYWGACLRVSATGVRVHGIGFQLNLLKGRPAAYSVAISKGEALLERCAFTSNSGATIAVTGKEARPTIRSCEISNGNGSGIYFFDHSTGLVEDCEIVNNAGNGVRIRTGGRPTVRQCRILKNGEYGVYGDSTATGRIEECDIRQNASGAFGLVVGHRVTGKGNLV
jgi:hypothetical protein